MMFSVVTVTFNAQGSLPGTMRSLAVQGHKDYEWVVADGKSGDATLAVAAEFDAAPVSIVSEADSGIYDAMNKAIKRAQGEYIYFLNSDDEFASADVLAKAASLLSAGKPDLLIGRVLFVGGARDKLRSYAHITPHRLLFDSLCHQAVFARRDLFERFGDFDLGLRYSADYDWLIRVMQGGARVAHTDCIVSRFRVGGAHAQAASKTAQENEAVRRRHASPLALGLGRAWYGNLYRARRLLGLEATGHNTLDTAARS